MFKIPHQEWLDHQPKHTQEWLKKQALWHDIDMVKACLFVAFVGLIIGLIL